MIRHILRLMWNRKRSLVWIFIEQVFVFGVMLFCFTVLSDTIFRHYSKGTVQTDNVVTLDFEKFDKEDQTEDDAEANRASFNNMVEAMKEWPSVELISIGRGGATPGSNSDSFSFDTITFNGQGIRSSVKYCDENYYKMFSPTLKEGAWFRDSDAFLDTPPVVVTQRLIDRADFTGSAVGQTIFYNGRTYRITGVVEAYKDRPTENQLTVLFVPATLSPGDIRWDYMVKHKQGLGSDFSKAFMAEFYRNFPRDQFQPQFIEIYKFFVQLSFIQFTLKVSLLAIPTAFLLIFAFMGTFGVVWMQTKKRTSEMGLRIAMGCTPARLMLTVILENLILTTIAMLPGLIVVFFLYIFDPEGWEWSAAVGAAVVFMWLFSIISAWYPAWKAAKVQPVEALKSNQ